MPRLAFLLLALVAVGCERPFVEPEAPTLDLVSPTDLEVVRTEAQLPLAFRASSSFTDVRRVEVNGAATTYVREGNVYLDTLRLDLGLNRIVVNAFDGLGTVGTDTLFAVYLPSQFAAFSVLRLPEPVGGHAATTLPDGTVLITGGSASVNAPARDTALLFDPVAFSFSETEAPVRAARVGHAASRLPDGRVLLTGGSRVVTPTAPDDFVTTVELFDPATGAFTEVPVVAADGGSVAPVARAGHTVTVVQGSDGTVSVYLYGGTANLGTAEAPRLGPSPFMRRLVFEDGGGGPRLVAPNRSEGFRFAATAGHTQTPLDARADGFGRYLVAGVSDPADLEAPLPFELTFAPEALDARAVAPLQTPRTEHAAAPLALGAMSENLVLVTGGQDAASGAVLATGEVFAGEAARFFRFNEATRLAVPRRSHTATNLDGTRILIVGGFSASGDALDLIELFTGLPSR